jgi:hypothetical protein
MNLTAHPDCLEILSSLPERYQCYNIGYELVCGVDWRYINDDILFLMKKKRFSFIRWAWDGPFSLQYEMHSTFRLISKYFKRNLSCFILCNHEISYDECLAKLDLLKIWNVKVCDCYYDGQTSPNFKEIYWTINEMKNFRKKCRKHNQMVLFGIDPEYSKGMHRRKNKIKMRTLDDL